MNENRNPDEILEDLLPELEEPLLPMLHLCRLRLTMQLQARPRMLSL